MVVAASHKTVGTGRYTNQTFFKSNMCAMSDVQNLMQTLLYLSVLNAENRRLCTSHQYSHPRDIPKRG
jgi:hypothetical protein